LAVIYVNRTGKLTIETEFNDAGLFENGAAEVITSRSQKAYLNTDEKITWEHK
jgi:hypothetical protein